MGKDEYIEKESINMALSSALKEANIKECLYPDKNNCSEKIIRAHSIQNNRILNRISENGEVLMAQADASSGNFEIKMKLIGKKKATTFSGFCSYHDNLVFKPIEDFEYMENNSEQNALFAFRAFAKEWHAKLRSQKLLKNETDEYLKLCLNGTELALKDIQEYVEIFKKILVEREFESLWTVHISFKEEFHFAVSSGVSFPYDFEGNRLDHLKPDLDICSKFLFVTIFPQNGKTHILLSCLKKDRDFYAFIKSQLDEVEPNIQKIRIGNLIMMNCENLVISPSCWDRLNKDQQNLFLSMFKSNLDSFEKPHTLGTDFGLSLFV